MEERKRKKKERAVTRSHEANAAPASPLLTSTTPCCPAMLPQSGAAAEAAMSVERSPRQPHTHKHDTAAPTEAVGIGAVVRSGGSAAGQTWPPLALVHQHHPQPPPQRWQAARSHGGRRRRDQELSWQCCGVDAAPPKSLDTKKFEYLCKRMNFCDFDVLTLAKKCFYVFFLGHVAFFPQAMHLGI